MKSEAQNLLRNKCTLSQYIEIQAETSTGFPTEFAFYISKWMI